MLPMTDRPILPVVNCLLLNHELWPVSSSITNEFGPGIRIVPVPGIRKVFPGEGSRVEPPGVVCLIKPAMAPRKQVACRAGAYWGSCLSKAA